MKTRLSAISLCLIGLSGVLLGVLTISYRLLGTEYYIGFDEQKAPLCGLRAVAIICALNGVETDFSTIYKYSGVDTKGTSLDGCAKALQELGIDCEIVKGKAIATLPEDTPILMALRAKYGYHAVVAIRRAENVLVFDGNRRFVLDVDEFTRPVCPRIYVIPKPSRSTRVLRTSEESA